MSPNQFEWRGIGVVMPTPLTVDDSVNVEELRALYRYIADGGADMIAGPIATGQYPALSREEVSLVMQTAIDTVGDEMGIVGYTSASSTREAVDRTKEAATLGVDAVLQLPPWYVQPTEEEIYEHFSTVIEETDVPVVLYNHKPRTGVELAPEISIRLAREYDDVVGLKDRDIDHVYEVLSRTTEDDLTVLSGSLEFHQLPNFITLGAHGWTSVSAQIAPEVVDVPLLEASRRGDHETIREIVYDHRDLLSLFKEMDYPPRNINYMLELMGWEMGTPRGPYVYPPSKENRETYEQVLREYNLLDVRQEYA